MRAPGRNPQRHEHRRVRARPVPVGVRRDQARAARVHREHRERTLGRADRVHSRRPRRDRDRDGRARGTRGEVRSGQQRVRARRPRRVADCACVETAEAQLHPGFVEPATRRRIAPPAAPTRRAPGRAHVRAAGARGDVTVARQLVIGPLLFVTAIVVGWLAGFSAPFDDVAYSRVIYAADGRLLGARIASDGQWRLPLGPQPLPDRFVVALTTFEDVRFHAHPGVDPIAIARAALSNLRARRVVSGGSTITMQVARLARSNQPRTLIQKATEALLALRIELAYSKPDVVRLFAAHAPFGGNVVGIEAAAWRYFGRPLIRITWAEAALLAVLPNSPSLMHLTHERDALRAKRDRLLDRLYAAGRIDEHELRLAQGEPIPTAPHPLPHDALHLLGTLAARHPDQWRFDTTIDRSFQQRASQIVAAHGIRLRSIGVAHAAAIVVHVPTGAVRSYVGNLPPSNPPGAGDYVDIVQARRSTGSLLKPFLYAAMIDSGELIPGQIVPDVPTRIGGYIPENHTGDFLGAVRVDVALARSLNVPAARLLQQYGVDRFHGVLRELGMRSLTRSASHYGIPLILGGSESTLWELTGMYASMARTVRERAPGALTVHPPYVIPSDAGQSDAARSPLSPAASYLTLEALREVERPEEFQGWRHFRSADEISWKTGTSYGLRDAWAIGVNAEYAVGVWVGNATGRGAPGLRGTAIAGPVMFELFEMLGRAGSLYSPGGLTTVPVCRDSGLLAGPDCRASVARLLPVTALDRTPCSYCRTIHLDETGAMRVAADFYPTDLIVQEKRLVLPEAMAWYYQRRATDYQALPPVHPRLSGDTVASVAFEFPTDDASVFIPIEMSGRRGSIVAVVRPADPRASIFWHLNGDFIGVTERTHSLELSPRAGVHELTVVTSAGATARVRFRVLDRE
ncbi:MAG: penicillin-binding protein 1C [Spirochaetaceae bacterium]|nr:MAG: penicillin-binding protein 1C [Spirochaetaceae bacterium]